MAGNVEEFFGIDERVSGIMIKLQKRCTIKTLQAHAPMSTDNDDEEKHFYHHVQEAIKKNVFNSYERLLF